MPIVKRSVNILGHATSITLENEFWQELKNIAKQNKKPLRTLIAEIDEQKELDTSLSSAIRLYVLNSFKKEP